MKCCQCGKQAILLYDFGPLCVNCNLKFIQAQDITTQNLERSINYLKDQMDYVMGIKTFDRFPERKSPVIQNAPVTMNNTIFDRSIVGSVNTGYIRQLEVSMNNVTQVNNDGTEKIKKFTEELLKEKELDKGQKEEIIQQLDFLTKQLSLKPEQRNKAVIKSILFAISGAINLSASLITLWAPVKALFGF